MEIPIHHMTTQKRWADVVLNPSALEQIDQLLTWIKQQKEITHTKNKLRAALEKIDLDLIAEKYEMSSRSIMNVVHHVNNTSHSQNTPAIILDLVTKEIQREYTLKTKADN